MTIAASEMESGEKTTTHLAQYTVDERRWSTSYEPSLFVYGDKSGAEVLAFALNRTRTTHVGGDDVFVAGQFDSISEESQSQYCSLGRWTGMRPPKEALQRVGEGGLCSRASDPATKLYAAVLAENGDLIVGGTFSSRVWDGASFVSLRHIARFDTRRNVWMPLKGGSLGFLDHHHHHDEGNATDESTNSSSSISKAPSSSLKKKNNKGTNTTTLSENDDASDDDDSDESSTEETTTTTKRPKANATEAAVLALAYHESRLFIGGRFTSLGGEPTSAGLVEYTQATGLTAFRGGGLGRTRGGLLPEASALALDAVRGKLYVAGIFDRAGGLDCRGLAEYDLGTTQKVFDTNSDDNDDDWHDDDQIDDVPLTTSSPGTTKKHAVTPTNRRRSYLLNATQKRNTTTVTPQKRTDDDVGYWKCILPLTHEMDVVHAPVSLLFDGESLFLAGRAAKSSSWYTTANESATAAVARYTRFESYPYAAAPPPTGGHRRRRLRRRRRLVRRLSGTTSAQPEPPPGPKTTPVTTGPSTTDTPPTQRYNYAWEWLPGWRGMNGTILTLAAGAGSYAGCLFVGGDFGSEPPLMVWCRDEKLGPYTRRFLATRGVVTAVAMAVVAHPYQTSPTIDNEPSGNGAARFLRSALTGLASALVAAVLFVMVGRRRRWIFLTTTTESGGPLFSGGGPAGPGLQQKKSGISLQMLSYGFGGSDLDFEFSDAYERAMKARHLNNRQTLVMIDPSEITLHEVIGEGSFGRVWSATWQTSAVAVKEFVLAQAACAGGSMHRRDIIEEIVGEAGIMAYLRHPKILQLYGCSLTAQAIWIVSELCTYGSLRQVLDDKSIPLPVELRLRMAIDVAEGMLYLHTRDSPIVHRDLKSHNLFVVDQNGVMKVRIGDWGSARAVAMSPNFSKTMTHGVGTTCWLAPELIKDAKGSERIDVYAFGIVLWELATREEVYAALSAAQIISRVANEGMRPPLPPGCPWNHVMEACWSEDPAHRPDFEDIFAQLTRIYETVTGHDLPADGDNFVKVGRNRSQSEDVAPAEAKDPDPIDDASLRRSLSDTSGRRSFRTRPASKRPSPRQYSNGGGSSYDSPTRVYNSGERDRLLGYTSPSE